MPSATRLILIAGIVLAGGCTAAPPTSTAADPASAATQVAAPADATVAADPLALRLCHADQLSAEVTHWEGNTGTPLATIRVTNSSASPCEMRGKPEAQIVDANGGIIGDEGRGAAQAAVSDTPIYLAPGASARTTVSWANWCTARPPAQSLTIGLVQPLGLGRVVADPLGPAPVPDCQFAAETPPVVISEAWSAP